MRLSQCRTALVVNSNWSSERNYYETLYRILAKMPHVKILAFSIQAENGFMARMMRAGALGYILKGSDSEELSGIIRRTAGSLSAERVDASSPSFQSQIFSQS